MKKILGLLAGTVLCAVAVSGFAQVASATCVKVTLESSKSVVNGSSFEVDSSAAPKNTTCTGNTNHVHRYGLSDASKKISLAPNTKVSASTNVANTKSYAFIISKGYTNGTISCADKGSFSCTSKPIEWVVKQ